MDQKAKANINELKGPQANSPTTESYVTPFSPANAEHASPRPPPSFSETGSPRPNEGKTVTAEVHFKYPGRTLNGHSAKQMSLAQHLEHIKQSGLNNFLAKVTEGHTADFPLPTASKTANKTGGRFTSLPGADRKKGVQIQSDNLSVSSADSSVVPAQPKSPLKRSKYQ